MTAPKHSGGTGAGGRKPGVEAIQADIEQTREQLGETVDELAAKLDVKSKTKARAADVKSQANEKAKLVQERATELGQSAKDSATDSQGNPKPSVLGGAASVAAVVLGVIVLASIRKKRRGSHGS
ncbi:uncharacterized protein DUF3618 [Nocardioides albertanoniae]|uniref:Uncharacterized protein DUF3618 n=1 Tax=Nocardioides albertanoniae TaxID=1175486 RepID=A0A543A8Q5_9ACTN|nr:DUF3618 domain-containing protein [Nocardioides albertanoniae]TQL68977.1 uncharacterized protein DUF3618 [Nocardioides albertanoniae]